MLAWLGANNFAHDSAEGQMRYMAREAMSGAYPRTRRVLMGATPERLADDQWTITREFEAPAVTNDRSGAVARAYGAGVAAGRGGLPSGGYWAKDSKGNPVAVGPDGHAVQGARRGSAFNAARQTGAFGLSGPVARSGEASLSVHITADGKVKTQADGGELFNRVDVDRGRTVSAEQ